ncbi:hypothetical protein CC86DRAFT_406041 [Ophiobolus disseminans]|uniref:Uncharacterized protein n=1 Tax=Ophiobolus disseminans TaxID=1469910 RepID=A0A6A7A1N4_9PLEO|nr:hypothetical protein CC86DRAFT_406041 [Ophiobolus disseminans]
MASARISSSFENEQGDGYGSLNSYAHDNPIWSFEGAQCESDRSASGLPSLGSEGGEQLQDRLLADFGADTDTETVFTPPSFGEQESPQSTEYNGADKAKRMPPSDHVRRLLEKLSRFEDKIERKETKLANSQGKGHQAVHASSVERDLEELYEKLSEVEVRVREQRSIDDYYKVNEPKPRDRKTGRVARKDNQDTNGNTRAYLARLEEQNEEQNRRLMEDCKNTNIKAEALFARSREFGAEMRKQFHQENKLGFPDDDVTPRHQVDKKKTVSPKAKTSDANIDPGRGPSQESPSRDRDAPPRAATGGASSWIDRTLQGASPKLNTLEQVLHSMRQPNVADSQHHSPRLVLHPKVSSRPESSPECNYCANWGRDHCKPDWFDTLIHDDADEDCTCVDGSRAACVEIPREEQQKATCDGGWPSCGNCSNCTGPAPRLDRGSDQPKSASKPAPAKDPELKTSMANLPAPPATVLEKFVDEQTPALASLLSMLQTETTSELVRQGCDTVVNNFSTLLPNADWPPIMSTKAVENEDMVPERVRRLYSSADSEDSSPAGARDTSNDGNSVRSATHPPDKVTAFMKMTSGEFLATEAQDILNMSHGQLEIAEALFNGASTDHLRQMLKTWLSTPSGKPSHTNLSKTLDSNSQGSVAGDEDGSQPSCCGGCFDGCNSCPVPPETADPNYEHNWIRSPRSCAKCQSRDLFVCEGGGVDCWSCGSYKEPFSGRRNKKNAESGKVLVMPSIDLATHSNPYVSSRSTKYTAPTAESVAESDITHCDEHHWTRAEDNAFLEYKRRYPLSPLRVISEKLGVPIHICKDRYKMLQSANKQSKPAKGKKNVTNETMEEDKKVKGTKQQGKKVKAGTEVHLPEIPHFFDWDAQDSQNADSIIEPIDLHHFGGTGNNNDCQKNERGAEVDDCSHWGHEMRDATEEAGGGAWGDAPAVDSWGLTQDSEELDAAGRGCKVDPWNRNVIIHNELCNRTCAPLLNYQQGKNWSCMSSLVSDRNHATTEPAAPIPAAYTVTYWATIECGDQNIHIPVDNSNISGPEKAILDGPGMKVWKWVQDKGLGDKISLQDAFDLAKDMHSDEEEKDEAVEKGGSHLRNEGWSTPVATPPISPYIPPHENKQGWGTDGSGGW